MEKFSPQPEQSQSRNEARQGLDGFSTQQTEHIPQQENAAKPSRIPDQKIAFVQHAFAYGADDELDDRRRIFLAHSVTKPHLTLRELAPFAGIHTRERARQLLDTSLQMLWQASPPELQQQYPLELLRRYPSTGVLFSAEHKLHISEAQKGKKRSPETRAKISEAHKGKKLSAEHRAKISEAHKGKKPSAETRAKISETHKGKKRSAESRAKQSYAMRKHWQHRKQHDTDLTQSNQEQHGTIQAFPFPPKT